jgi:Family of unknown function (DUF6325)
MDGPHDDWDRPVDVDADLVEYVIVGVPELASLDSVAKALATLVRSNAIRILDVVVLVKAGDGSVEVLEFDDVDALRGMREVGGFFGGLLSSRDLSLVADAVMPDTAAIVLLAEDRWAGPLSVAARAAGGSVLGGERIPRGRIHPALADAADLVDPSGPAEEDEEEEKDHATDDETT